MNWECWHCKKLYPIDYEPDFCEDCGDEKGVLTRVITRFKRENIDIPTKRREY